MWFLENAWLIPVIPGVALLPHPPVRQAAAARRAPRSASPPSMARRSCSPVGAVVPVDPARRRRRREQRGGPLGVAAGVRALGRRRRARAGTAEHVRRAGDPPVDVVAERRRRSSRIGIQIDGLAVIAAASSSRFISLLVHIYSLEYVRGDRRYTHFFAALTLFTAGMLVHGPRREHGPAHPRLGDHGPLLVHADRALVGGRGQRPRRAEGVLHHPRRRHRPARRHVDPVLRRQLVGPGAPRQRRLQHPGHLRRGRCPATASHTVLLWRRVRAVHRRASASAASSRCTPGCPTPWPARRRCRRCCTPSTMVVAGVFLVARLYPVFCEGFTIGRRQRQPDRRDRRRSRSSSPALLAFVQNDIKKVLAYSTVSQLGYMMMGLGVGAWTAGRVPHLHPRLLQGLPVPRRRLGEPLRLAPLLRHEEGHGRAAARRCRSPSRRSIIATLALAGMFPLAGFFSKDEIIDNVGPQRLPRRSCRSASSARS